MDFSKRYNSTLMEMKLEINVTNKNYLILLCTLGCSQAGKSSIVIDDSAFEDSATVDSGTPSTIDQDGDGFSQEDDCNDANPDIHPQAQEICNAIDDNCNGSIDDNLSIMWYEDNDGDGAGGNLIAESCEGDPAWVETTGDCDDFNSEVYPNNPNRIDGIDSDCDGRKDWLVTIYVAVDDAGELCVNGLALGETGEWTTGLMYETWLPSGSHTVGIHGWDLGMVITAAIGHIEISTGEIWGTDATWKYDPEPATVLGGKEGWCNNGFDDSTWGYALDVGPIGDPSNPWGNAPSNFPSGSPAHWIWDHFPVNLNSQYLRKEITLP